MVEEFGMSFAQESECDLTREAKQHQDFYRLKVVS